MKRIATHKKPDADALVAVWLAQRFLFAGQKSEIVFLSRGARIDETFDCVVDIGNCYDANCARFDHKPPAFADRNAHCASELLWRHLVLSGASVEHLQSLVEIVHQGDARPPRRVSPQLAQSRSTGLHAQIKHCRAQTQGDAELFRCVCYWLDEFHFNALS